MKSSINTTLLLVMAAMLSLLACTSTNQESMSNKEKSAEQILGNPDYQAISYGGYREATRDIQPTIEQLKEDMRILHAMGIRMLRTYNVHLPEATNLLKAISQMKQDDPNFEMYIMLGVWIDCKNAWTDLPDRIRDEDSPRNQEEVNKAVELTKAYPDIIKVVAVGNEAMVKWASEYYVEPQIILRWVNHFQDLKAQGELPADLWITSSDNFASWGGGGEEYHVEALNELIKAVDFLSVHTYPMHDTHYNPIFWGVSETETSLSKEEQIEAAMKRSLEYAIDQYNSVVAYMQAQGVDKPVHIGETGWASVSNYHYGPTGSKATDEYKLGLFYNMIREWSNENNISVFYFEAFNEKWKDARNQQGSENHFGLITLDAQAKYPIWDLVDQGIFEGLTRDGLPITKTYGGNLDSLMQDVLLPPTKTFELQTNTTN